MLALVFNDFPSCGAFSFLLFLPVRSPERNVTWFVGGLSVVEVNDVSALNFPGESTFIVSQRLGRALWLWSFTFRDTKISPHISCPLHWSSSSVVFSLEVLEQHLFFVVSLMSDVLRLQTEGMCQFSCHLLDVFRARGCEASDVDCVRKRCACRWEECVLNVGSLRSSRVFPS